MSDDPDKELRILRRKLERSEADRVQLELNKEKDDALLRKVISDLHAAQAATEAKQGELLRTLEELQSTRDELVNTAKMAALGELVAGIAHEVNTPLGTAITAATHLSDSTADIARAAESGELTRSSLSEFIAQNRDTAEMIERNLTRAADLIRSFKLVAVDRSVSGQRRFNVGSYLKDVLNSLSARLRKTRIEVEVSGPDTLEIESDPGLFSQVITNLIMNSLFHGFADGEQGRIKMTYRGEGKLLVLQYADDGCGIPAEILPRIFDPFFTTKRGAGGSGLGLNIIHNIVTKQLGGHIECRSESGQGARFELAVPGVITEATARALAPSG